MAVIQGFISKEREVPPFKSYSGKQNSRMRKNKKGFHMLFGDKIKNWQGLQIDQFLISLRTKKYIFFLPQRVPPTNGGDPWEMVWIGQVLTQSILGN